MKKVELLSPAGDFESLKAAINAGCDAVYLAGKLFGARAFASNFNDEELVNAINYCHLYGVKIYLTVNTIIYDDEVDKFINYIRFVHKNNIDAIIIQDLGMFDLVRKKFPNLEIHLSTQTDINNYDAALMASKLGAKRIVVSREMPYDVIKKIKDNIDIEVECFIHGALCVSYSGQCFMSSLIGNRSGNRGTCSQCCRKKYNLFDIDGNKLNNENYLLSMKDLNTSSNLDKIINTNCDSLKIEGRLKSPMYVYLVTLLYRNIIDKYYETGKICINDRDILKLKKVFNRTYTKGFILNEKNSEITNSYRPNHIGIEIGKVISKNKNIIKIKLSDNLNVQDGIRILDSKEDKGFIVTSMQINNKNVLSAKKDDIISIYYDGYVEKNASVLLTYDSNLTKDIKEKINKNDKKILVDMNFIAKENNKMKLTITDKKNTVHVESDNILSLAVKCITDENTIKNQLNKTGDTIYRLNNLNIDMDDNLFINIKDINKLRRDALNKLDEKRLYDTNFKEEDYYCNVLSFDIDKKENIEYRSNIGNFNCDEIYVANKDEVKGENYVLKIPRVINTFEKYDKKVLVGELGAILNYKNFYTDFSFNVVNSYTVAFLHELGALKVTLSPEINYERTKKLIDNYVNRYNKRPNIEVILNSNLEAMICKFDLNKKYNVKKSFLKDEYNNKYKIISYDNYMIIYDYKKSNVLDKEKYYEIGINNIRNIID